MGNNAASSIEKSQILYKFFVVEKLCKISLDPDLEQKPEQEPGAGTGAGNGTAINHYGSTTLTGRTGVGF